MVKTLQDRLWEKIDQRGPHECWPFTGSRTERGYGRIWDGTQTPSGSPRQVRAHRLAYQFRVGPIPDGYEICHQCDNPPCCNPAHLFAATHRENMIHASQNGRWTHKLKGERNPAAKLTAAQVAEARDSYTGQRGQVKALAEKYGVASSTMSFVLRGEHWT